MYIQFRMSQTIMNDLRDRVVLCAMLKLSFCLFSDRKRAREFIDSDFSER